MTMNTNTNPEPKKSRVFLKAIIFTVIALSLVECGRIISLKKLQSEIPASEAVLTRDADEYFFTASFKDLQEELESVKQAGQTGLFVFFEMQDCPYCEYMKQKVLNQVEVQNYYNKHFRSITIDIHTATEASDVDGSLMTEKALAAKYGVDLTPTMIFFARDGSEVYRKQGFIKEVPAFLAMGKEIVGFLEPQ